MALDFPNSPTVGQVFVGPNNTAYAWDGTKWIALSAAPIIPIAQGGTGQTTAIAAFKALSPLSAKGDILSYDGTNDIRVPASPGSFLGWDASGNVVARSPPAPVNGRLTLTSNTPVMTADVANGNTIYFTPYLGNQILIWNGTSFVSYSFSQLSLALSTTAHPAGGPYDLFVWNNAGTLQLVTGPIWSGNARTAGGLAFIAGIPTNAQAINAIASGNTPVTIPANQGTYVGTMLAYGAGICAMDMNPAGASGGGPSHCYLWNYFNRRLTAFTCIDNGANYTYNSNTVRQARSSPYNAVFFVIGVPEDAILVSQFCSMLTAAAAGNWGQAIIGLDSASVAYLNQNVSYIAFTVAAYGQYMRGYNHRTVPMQAFPNGGLGSHYVSRLEWASGATTFCNDGWELLTLGIMC